MFQSNSTILFLAILNIFSLENVAFFLERETYLKSHARVNNNTQYISKESSLFFSTVFCYLHSLPKFFFCTIHFSDSATPNSKAKPTGVHGCEIWAKVGDAIDYSYLATDTKTPYIATYTQAEAGKRVSYRLRWVNTSGETGPFGAACSGMIVG